MGTTTSRAACVVATVLLAANAATALDVSGTVSSNALWSDTVRLTGDVTIANGVTVTVAPGTVVVAQGKYRLNVSGRILASGTPSDSIRFKATSPATGWYGIRFPTTAATNDSSLLEYCILTEGLADGTSANGTGGALLAEGFAKVRISHCLFLGNTAHYGGAIYLASQANIVITDCIFDANQANGTSSDGLGGALYASGASPVVSNCEFRDNAAITAGAICLRTSSAQILNCTIVNNRATGIMSQNYHGGGVYLQQCTARIEGNVIAYNMSQRDGGGIYVSTSPQSVIARNRICNNGARDGGGVFVIDGATTLVSNIVVNNNTGTYGGGICLRNADAVILNATIANNMGEEGGGLAAIGGSDAAVRNCIFWGNRATWGGNQGLVSASSPVVTFCAVESGQTEFAGTGTWQDNATGNPLFVQPSAGLGTQSDGRNANWSLGAGSPCINTGSTDTGGVGTLDAAGNARVDNGRIDMGAQESGTVNAAPRIVPHVARAQTLVHERLVGMDGRVLNARGVSGVGVVRCGTNRPGLRFAVSSAK